MSPGAGGADRGPPPGELEIPRRQERPVAEQRGALHRVGQLADVPRPGVRQQRRARVRGQAPGRQPVVLADAAQEVLGEEDHVRAAIPERRQHERDDGQAMVEVAPEASGPHGGRQVLAGGRDHARVDALAARAAEPPHRAILDRPQELRLQAEGHQADLVQEQGAAIRGLEETRLGLHRAGERSALEAEQLGLQQRLGDGGAVQVYERPCRPGALAVDAAGQQALARARLAQDEDGREPAVGAGGGSEQPMHLLAHVRDRGALAEELRKRRHRGAHRTARGNPAAGGNPKPTKLPAARSPGRSWQLRDFTNATSRHHSCLLLTVERAGMGPAHGRDARQQDQGGEATWQGTRTRISCRTRIG